jgi:hypothetical protein
MIAKFKLPVIWRGVTRGYDLFAALWWLAIGGCGVWLFWSLAALPDIDLQDVTGNSETLGETRNFYLACLVFGVLLAVYGLHRIRQWRNNQ